MKITSNTKTSILMNQVKGEYDVFKGIKAQKDLCEAKGYPHFAPTNGICWTCNKNIYAPLGRKCGQPSTWIKNTGRRKVESCPLEEAEYITGITVNEAKIGLITGCPHCYRSYCD